MKFRESQLIQFVKYCPPLPPRLRPRPRPRLRLRPLLRPRLRPRLRPGDLGIIVEATKASEAWENYQEYNKKEQAQIPNCYIVFWQKQNKRTLVYEDEIAVI